MKLRFGKNSVLFIFVLLLQNCAVKLQERTLTPPIDTETLDQKSPFLKVHMLSGMVYLLSNWSVDLENQNVTGEGSIRDINREVIKEGRFSIEIDSVAIFETNVVNNSPAIGGMAVLTGLSAGVTLYCAANPKACFGSCPTFYVTNGKELKLQAEGFSGSVAPFLEATDVDALYNSKAKDGKVELVMKNEAFETHIVRYVDLLVAPKPKDGRVFKNVNGTFWQATQIENPIKATGPEGDCLNAIAEVDSIERFSLASATNLAEKEIIDLEFAGYFGEGMALVIAARQTLLTTYLFYQSLAYMGRSVGDWFANMQRNKNAAKEGFTKIKKEFEGIEVSVENESGEWQIVGNIHEVGPLATDVHLLELPGYTRPHCRVRLRLTRGFWRLNYVALAKLAETIDPLRLHPVKVEKNQQINFKAKETLLNHENPLITLPGDEFTIIYHLPSDNSEYELFLESRGYYLEWIRNEWLADENQYKAAQFFTDPTTALRQLAPEFKKIEAEMEEIFWRSHYAKQ